MSLIPQTAWSELTPAGSDQINAGDNRIREMKTQLREVLAVDHLMASSGQSTTTGYHKQVTLIESADIGTGSTGYPILGSQTISSKPELVYTDEDDNDIQITKAGVLKPSTSTVLADWSAAINLFYPVGIVLTFGVSTNPATLLGVGTWTAIAGKVIVGIDGTQTEFDTLDETGGAKTHTLDITEIPAHTHPIASSGDLVAGGGSYKAYGSSANSGSTGGGAAHNNLQPYIVKYVWQRTA